jgi:modulator of FtsH protease HflC
VNMIKRYIVWFVVLIFIGAMLAYTMTYTVRFTESAVVTRFGKAVVEKDGSNPKGRPGAHFKWFYPVDSVTKYDTRMRFLQARSETQQTADNFQIVIEGFATYRVSDPLSFYRRFSSAGPRAIDHFREAEGLLRSRLRSALGETSKYRMEELFDPTVGGSKLGQLESTVLELMAGGVGRDGGTRAGEALADYGIEVTMVGIDRVVLPELTTKSVMDRMEGNRSRLASKYTAEGAALAQTIRASANASAERIRAFAQSRAKEIIAQGEQEAAQYLAQQNTHPELAIFLQNLELMRDALARKVTLVLSTDTFGMQLFNPGVADELGRGEFPVGIPSPGDMDVTSVSGGEDSP